LLGLGRFSLSLAGLDSASSFGNLGSNREMLFHFLTEVSLFPAIAALLLWANAPDKGQPLFWLAALAILMSFFPILLLEARRLPVDNPETHLELTMAGKAVELEFSGRDPALVKWGEMNKLLFLTALWSQGLFWLVGVEVASWWLALLLYAGLWLLTASGLAAWEWRTPKIRLGHIPTVARASLFFSLFAILLRLIPGG
jgi:formate hydrogenlyase subunit 4